MALQKCAGCGGQVSENAKACPQCGEPPKKRTSVLTIVIAAVFGIVVFSSVYRSQTAPTAPAAPPTPEYPRAEISSAARNVIRQGSKDPDSLKFRNEFVARPGIHCGEVNGKNSFGGYTGFKRFITNDRRLMLDDGSMQNFDAAWREFCQVSATQRAVDP